MTDAGRWGSGLYSINPLRLAGKRGETTAVRPPRFALKVDVTLWNVDARLKASCLETKTVTFCLESLPNPLGHLSEYRRLLQCHRLRMQFEPS